MDWTLPDGFSTFAGDIDRLYYIILVITGIAFFVVEAVLIWFLFRYRARPGQPAVYIHGSNKAEVIWTSVTAVTVVIIGLMSGGVWNRIKGRDGVPPGAYPLAVQAKQFEWNVTYPGPDGQLGSADDFTVRNEIHVPVNRPVVVHLTSEDVIHSFAVPAFRVKQDAVPGMHIQSWFQATEPGEYELGCAELCGLQHYRMRAMVIVHNPEDFEQWTTERSRTVALR